jgi:hypothetical protein
MMSNRSGATRVWDGRRGVPLNHSRSCCPDGHKPPTHAGCPLQRNTTLDGSVASTSMIIHEARYCRLILGWHALAICDRTTITVEAARSETHDGGPSDIRDEFDSGISR